MKEKINYSELIKEIKSGDIKAFQVLYQESFPYFHARVMQYIKNSQDIEDVLQNVYLTIYQKIDTLKDTESFMAWGLQICSHQAINEIKRQKAKKNSFMLIPNHSENDEFGFDVIPVDTYKKDINPEAYIDVMETKRLLDEILDDLSEVQRICILRWKEEIPLKGIAEELGIPLNTVKTHISRAKRSIKEKVLQLEKRGTKLYGMAPIPFLLWLMKTYETSFVPIINVEAQKVLFTKIGSEWKGKISDNPHSRGRIPRGESKKRGVFSSMSKAMTAKICVGVASVVIIAVGAVVGMSQFNDSETQKSDIQTKNIQEESGKEVEQKKKETINQENTQKHSEEAEATENIQERSEKSVEEPSTTELQEPTVESEESSTSESSAEVTHTHTWVEIAETSQEWVVDTEAVYNSVYWCINCDMQLDGDPVIHSAEFAHSYSTREIKIADETGHYETNSVVIGYECSCGAIK